MSKDFSLQRIGTAPAYTMPAEDPHSRLGATGIHELGQRGIAVAEAIASAEDFRHDYAEMSMRTLAALMNWVDADEYAHLPDEDREGLLVVAQDTFSFLHGDGAADEMRGVVELMRPVTAPEAELYLCQAAFNRMQSKVSIGPQHQDGYTPEEEPALRDFVSRYAQAFSSTLFGLSTIGSKLASKPDSLRYVISTIDAATPHSLR